jgi:hypothetical protein
VELVVPSAGRLVRNVAAPPSDCSPPLTAHDLDPCLDPTLHDQRTDLDPDTAEYGQSYPDGHDDVTTGAA